MIIDLKTSLSLLILLHVQLVSCTDINSSLERINELGDASQQSESMTPQEYFSLLTELNNLLESFEPNEVKSNIDAGPIIAIALMKIMPTIGAQFEKINDPNNRKILIDQVLRLRPFVGYHQQSTGFNKSLMDVDVLVAKYKLDHIHDQLMKPSTNEASTSEQASNSNLNLEISDTETLLKEFEQLKDGILRKLETRDEIIIKTRELEVMFLEKSINKIYDEIMGPLRESISEETINELEKLYHISYFMVVDLYKKFPDIVEKTKKLQELGSVYSGYAQCRGQYLRDIDRLKRKYHNGLQVQLYLETIRLRQINLCFELVNTSMRRQTKNDLRMDAAIARLSLVANFAKVDTGADFSLEYHELNVQTFGRVILKYLLNLGTQLNSTSENTLQKIDEDFDAYFKRHCKVFRWAEHLYEFVKNVLLQGRENQPHPPLPFWAREIMKFGNICRRLIGTEGRDWYLAMNTLLRSPLISAKERVSDVGEIFTMIEEMLLAAPSIEKILGNHNELREIPTYKVLIRLKEATVAEYHPGWIRKLRDYAAHYNNYPGLRQAIEYIRHSKIMEILQNLHNDMERIISQVPTEKLNSLTFFRSTFENNILGISSRNKENIVLGIVRASQRKDYIQSQIELVRAGYSGETDSERSMDNLSKVSDACSIMLMDNNIQNIYEWLWVIQEQNDYQLLNDSDIDFLVDFIICHNYPFEGESSSQYYTNMMNITVAP